MSNYYSAYGHRIKKQVYMEDMNMVFIEFEMNDEKVGRAVFHYCRIGPDEHGWERREIAKIRHTADNRTKCVHCGEEWPIPYRNLWMLSKMKDWE